MALSPFECRVSQAILKHPIIADKSEKNVEDKDDKVTKAFEQVQLSLKEDYDYQIPIAGLISMWDRIVKRVKNTSLKEKQKKLKHNLGKDDKESDEDTGKSEQEWENHFKKYGSMEEEEHIIIIKPNERKRRAAAFKKPEPKKQQIINKKSKKASSPQPSGSRRQEFTTDFNEIEQVNDCDGSVGKSTSVKDDNPVSKTLEKPQLPNLNTKSKRKNMKEQPSVDDTVLGEFMQMFHEIESKTKQESRQDFQQDKLNSKQICKVIDSLTGHRPCKTTGLNSKPKNIAKFPSLDKFAQRNKQAIEKMDQQYKNLEATITENSKNIFTNESQSIYFPLIYEKFSNVKLDQLDACMNEILGEISRNYN